MTRVILWKEVREQLAILVALLVMGAGLIVGVSALQPAGPTKGPLDVRGLAETARAMLLALVLVAGMVNGAALFAGEAELGTAKYLFTLPARRSQLFLAKLVTGLALATAVVGGLIAVGWGTGLYEGSPPGVWPAWLLLIGFASFSAGVAGSAVAHSTLVACGLGVLFGNVWGLVGLIPGAAAGALADKVFDLKTNDPDGAVLPVLAAPLFVIPAALLQAFLHFTGPDRRRKDGEFGPSPTREVARAARGVSLPHVRIGFRRLLWITRRQLFRPALFLGGFAVVVGLILLHPDAVPALVWPATALVLAALTGVIAFADEQTRGVNRYWSERQLPAGRLWLAKAAGSLALAIGLALLVILPRVIATIRGGSEPYRFGEVFHSGVIAAIGPAVLFYLLVGPIYGWVFGLFCGMLFKKPVVAAATAILLAGTTASLWMPSILSGGLHGWQVFLPPLAVLFTSRLLARAWANDRIGTRRGIRTIAVGSVAALGLLAAGIGYRAVEIEEAPEGNDDIEFSKTIPTYDDRQPGRDLRAASARFMENYRQVQTEWPEKTYGRVGRTGFAGSGEPSRQTYLEQLFAVVEMGWPENRPDLERWMDRLCAGDWIDKALAMRCMPAGVLEDPNDMTFISPYKVSNDTRQLTTALVVRGLQQQVRGDDAEFVRLADASLAATRTGRNKTTELGFMIARNWSAPVLKGLDVWLKNLDGRPDLLREMLAALQEHDANTPYDPAALRLAEQVVVRNSYKAPQTWAHRLNDFGLESMPRSPVDEKTGRAESEWLAFAWNVPWEKERLRRLIGRGNGTTPNVSPIRKARYWVEKQFDPAAKPPGSLADDAGLGEGLPGYDLTQVLAGFRRVGTLAESELVFAAEVRIAILKVALRLYQQETGKLPESLDPLVPKYLPAVPVDPFDGLPIRYRLSAGEVIYGKQKESTQPPGRDEWTTLTRRNFQGVAAVAGGGVYWPTATDAMLPPGRDEDVRLTPEQYEGVAAVAGGVVAWPMIFDELGPGGPGSLPGFTPGAGGPGVPWPGYLELWGSDEFHAMAAVAGGGVWWWSEPSTLFPAAPGFPLEEPLTEVQFDAIAAVSGAAVQWPLGPVLKVCQAADRVRIPTDLALKREEVEVAAGQAIVWSIGADRVDDHGLALAETWRGFGDIVGLVPVMPKPKGGGR